MTPDRQAFIRAMRSVANSVAIVTTEGVAGRHGATVTSFCSVSADPPSVLACLRIGSRIADKVTQNGRFCVNVLRHSASGLADRFAGRTAADADDRFAGIELVGLAAGLPRLKEAACALSCTLAGGYEAGSHLIVIGRVHEVHVEPEHPLCYLDGAYASVTRLPALATS